MVRGCFWRDFSNRLRKIIDSAFDFSDRFLRSASEIFRRLLRQADAVLHTIDENLWLLFSQRRLGDGYGIVRPVFSDRAVNFGKLFERQHD